MGQPQVMPIHPISKIYLVDDFISTMVKSASCGNSNFLSITNGAGSNATTLANPDTTRQGVAKLEIGTGGTGRSALVYTDALGSIKPTAGSFTMIWYVQIPVLSNGTNGFVVRAGFGDDVTAADFGDGIYFQYTDSINTHWQIKTAKASTRTTTTTSVTVVAGTWYKLMLTTTNGTTFSFSINGTSVGSISTNVPTAAVTPMVLINDTAGSGVSNAIYVDYFFLDYKLASVR